MNKAIIFFIIILSISCSNNDNEISPLPVVTTTSVQYTIHSAKISCDLVSNGTSEVTSKGICWSTTPNPTIANNTSIGGGEPTGLFISYINNELTANTLYYVRAYAINSSGTAYGNQLIFTTSPPGLPIVKTLEVSAINGTFGIGSLRTESDSSAPITQMGICWSFKGIPTINDEKAVYNGMFYGNLALNMTGLTPSTLYHVRAFATNSVGTAYGEVKDFSTFMGHPGMIMSIVSKIYNNGQVVEAMTTGKSYNYNNSNLVIGINENYLNPQSNEGISGYTHSYNYEGGKLVNRSTITHPVKGTSSPNWLKVKYFYTGNLIALDSTADGHSPFLPASKTTHYEYDGSERLVQTKVINLSNTILSQADYQNYLEENYSIKSFTSSTTNYTNNYTYDNKKNPYRLGFTSEYIKANAIPMNNPTSFGSTTFEYEYNANYYPTKITTKVNGVITNIDYFYYQ